MSRIENKTLLVTGATGGFGVEMTQAFLEEGGNLILSDLDSDQLERMRTRYKNHGRGSILGCIPADLSREEGVHTVFEKSMEFTDCPDFLVHNAGIAVMGPFLSVPEKKWERILSVNLLAPMRITHKFLPKMLERKSGHIVNISSVAGLVAVPGLTTYSVSKFGIKAFGEALEKEVSPFGIRVTNLYPFFTRTPILESEQIGVKEKLTVPDFLLSEPNDVIRRLVRGIKNNEVHVHPGGISFLLETGNRFFPGLVQSLNRLLVKS